MEKVNDRKRRFDETFRTLLIIVTLTTTLSFNLYRDSLGDAFFLDTFLFFIVSVIIWGFSNLADGTYEYVLKLLAWHFLIFDMVVSFIRMTTGQMLISPVLGYIVLFVILLPTYLIWKWFKKVQAIPTETFLSRKIFLILGIWTAIQMSFITFA